MLHILLALRPVLVPKVTPAAMQDNAISPFSVNLDVVPNNETYTPELDRFHSEGNYFTLFNIS